MARLLSPLRLTGIVTQGFGRGGKELGCPTANMDQKAVDTAKNLSTGVYYGFASVSGGPVFKAVTSVGWNPHYGNEEKSIEVHILHEFDKDFYGEELRFLFLGFIRDECKFESLEALKERINQDIKEGSDKLDQLSDFKTDELFR